MTTEQASLPMLTRAVASFVPKTIDEEARTVEVTWTTGATVRRQGLWSDMQWDERLSLDDGAVDLTRLANGAPLLNSHSAYDLGSVLGVVEEARVQGPKGRREGRATVRFSKRDDVQKYWDDVRDGIIRNISVGYSVEEWERLDRKDQVPLLTALRWTPLEISLVAVPADQTAQVRSQAERFPCTINVNDTTEHEMTRSAPGAAQEAAGDKKKAEAEKKAPEKKVEDAKAPEKVVEEQNAPAGDGEEAKNAPNATEPPTASSNPAIPANPSADAKPAEGERAHGGGHERQSAPNALTAVECQAIARSAEALGLPVKFASDLMGREGMTLNMARAAIIDAKAAGQEKTQVSPVHYQVTRDEVETRSQGMVNSILHRHDPAKFPLTEAGRDWMHYGPRELARSELEAAGINTRGWSPMEVARVALLPGYGVRQPGYRGVRAQGGLYTTSDLGSVLLDVVYKSARGAYEEAPQTFTDWCRRTTHRDFRLNHSVQLSGFGPLAKVPEHDEFPRLPMSDAKEAYKVDTYGGIFGITRQMIVNDDLGLFTTIPAEMGVAARDTESDVIYAVVLANAAMSDGLNLFHLNHNNLVSSGTSIGVDSVGVGFGQMVMQTRPDGKTPINVMPRFLLVPPVLWSKAEQLVGQVTPDQISGVVPARMRNLIPVIEPRLQSGVTVDGVTYAGSTTAWFMIADKARIASVEYAYLEGNEGVYTETETGFEIDGMKTKVRLDFGAKAIEWRSMFKNVGA